MLFRSAVPGKTFSDESSQAEACATIVFKRSFLVLRLALAFRRDHLAGLHFSDPLPGDGADFFARVERFGLFPHKSKLTGQPDSDSAVRGLLNPPGSVGAPELVAALTRSLGAVAIVAGIGIWLLAQYLVDRRKDQ